MDPENVRNVIFLFDGVCGICSHSVTFILKHDREKIFKFAPLQSEKATKILNELGLPPPDFSSSIVIENGKPFFKSDGVFKIATHLGFPWSVVNVFRIIPPSLRNRIYDWFAARRYRFFGKLNQCRVPSSDERDRFL